MPRTKGAGKTSAVKNTIKLFQKTIVEGKTVTAAAEEMGISRMSAQRYKKTDDFRKMAIEHLEGSTLNGLQGTVGKLVKALDAKRPIVTENADGSTSIKHVPDNKTQMQALQEVIKIYGLHAPVKKDVTARISISSDAEIFDQIEQAERDCRIVESYEVREGRFELATDQQRHGLRSPESRGRPLLHDAPVSEPQ